MSLNIRPLSLNTLMRYIFALLLLFAFVGSAVAQNEQSPITEKPFAYKDWTLKNLRGGGETNLREFARGKKLVVVVYWAPWCPNWKNDLAFVQSLHDKYSAAGLAIIGVGEYDPVGKMKDHLERYKLTFPSVYESDHQSARLTTVHYAQRTEADDRRKWGTPWYIFLDPATLKPAGEFLTEKTTVVNGELIKPEAEKYIRGKLGLDSATSSIVVKANSIEACEPEKNVAELKKP